MTLVNNGLNVLSLFDGLSAGMIALERANIPVNKYYASEIDKHAIKVSHSNYPEIIRIGDVTKVSYADGLLTTENGTFYVGKIDLVIGGSPCTGFSLAGKMLAFDDVQSKLYFEYERILKEVLKGNSKVRFLLENVKMKEIYQDAISERLGALVGNICEPVVINSNLVSAQNRHRLYWTNIPGVKKPEDSKVRLFDVLDATPEGSKIYLRKVSSKPKTNQIKSGCLTGGARTGGNHSDMDVIVFDQNDVPTSKSGRVCFKDSTKARRYSCEEWERLQTVPEGYTAHVSNTQRYKMLGNGWTVDVISHIFKNIPKKVVDNQKEPTYNSFIGQTA